MKLQLTKTVVAGEVTYRAANSDHAVFVQHLTGGMPSFGESFVESFRVLAKAHGWQVSLKRGTNNVEQDFFSEPEKPDVRFGAVIEYWFASYEEVFNSKPVLTPGKDHGAVKRFLTANKSIAPSEMGEVFLNAFTTVKFKQATEFLRQNAVSLASFLSYYEQYKHLPPYKAKTLEFFAGA